MRIFLTLFQLDNKAIVEKAAYLKLEESIEYATALFDRLSVSDRGYAEMCRETIIHWDGETVDATKTDTGTLFLLSVPMTGAASQ